VQAYLTGKSITVAGQAEPDALVMRLDAPAASLEPALRLAYLVLSEGRLPPERFHRWQTEAATRARADHDDPARRLEQATTAALMKDDARLRPPAADQIARLTAPVASAWLDAHLREAPLEVSLVGDLPPDDLIALGLKYFGPLPRRRRSRTRACPAATRSPRRAGRRVDPGAGRAAGPGAGGVADSPRGRRARRPDPGRGRRRPVPPSEERPARQASPDR
jgi:predicted Zn-dependent peptidase